MVTVGDTQSNYIDLSQPIARGAFFLAARPWPMVQAQAAASLRPIICMRTAISALWPVSGALTWKLPLCLVAQSASNVARRGPARIWPLHKGAAWSLSDAPHNRMPAAPNRKRVVGGSRQ